MRFFLLLFFCVLSLYVHADYTGFLPKEKKPIDVGIALFLYDIDYVTEATSSTTMTAHLYQQWHDSSLSFSSPDGQSRYYSGDAASDYLKTIWQPYLEIDEMMMSSTVSGQVVEIKPTGDISIKTLMEFTIDLNSDLRQFPFDKQSPKICIRSFTYDNQTVHLVRIPELEGLGDQIDIPSWNISNKFTAWIKDHHPLGGTKRFCDVYCFQVQLTRISLAYVYQLILPLFLIVVVSYLMMYVPIENSSKLNIMFTAILTIIAFEWLILNIIPTSSYVTFAEAVNIVGFIFCCLVTIVTCITLVHGIKNDQRAKKIFLSCRIILPILYILGNVVVAYAFFHT